MSGPATLEPSATVVHGVDEAVERLDRLDDVRSRQFRVFELGLIFGWWAIWGVFIAGQYLAVYAAAGISISLLDAASRAYLGAVVWALITLIAFGLSRRFPLDRRPRYTAIAVHVTAGAALASAEAIATFAVGQAAGWVLPEEFPRHFFTGFPSNLIYYWLLVGVGHGLNFYRRYREREANAARLEARLAQAELHLLKSQLHPHFLFNTLQAISTLMHRNPRAADRMLSRLSELLRVALDYSSTQEVSLEEELAFLEPYLEIERARLGDRLSFELDVKENVLSARVPHMILQPLVENAIRHGVAPRVAPGHIRVFARGRRNRLDLEVSDDGPGVPDGQPMNGGLGLTITRVRLEQLYGGDFLFEPSNAPGGGFRVSITIPFRMDPSDGHAGATASQSGASMLTEHTTPIGINADDDP